MRQFPYAETLLTLGVSALLPALAAAAPPTRCSARIVSENPVVAGELCTLQFHITAGSAGLRAGDVIEVRFPLCSPYPYTRWSPPALSPDSSGFTTTSSPLEISLARPIAAPACKTASWNELVSESYPLGIRARLTTDVPAGELLRVTYGNPGARGTGRARAQRFPEERVPFAIALLSASPPETTLTPLDVALEVQRTTPALLHVTGPSDATPGARIRLRVAALDSLGLPASTIPASTKLIATDESGHSLNPIAVTPSEDDPCVASAAWEPPRDGVWWIRAEVSAGTSNALRSTWDLPIVVRATKDTPLLYWGDLHWHSNVTDGSRSPREGYHYARHLAGLDFTALLDHDFTGLQGCLDDASWEENVQLANEVHSPPEFVTLLGYEWTWGGGDRSVYFRGDRGTFFPVTSYETPEELWAALAEGDVVTVPHHPVGGNVAPPVDWDHHDPRFQKSVEIYSMHGDAEKEETPLGAKPRAGEENRKLVERQGNVQRAMARGIDFGFIASTDHHLAAPGSPVRVGNRTIPAGPGLCGVWLDELSRESVFDAVSSGGTYGTTGPRIRIELTPEWDGGGRLQGVECFVVGASELETVAWVGVRSTDTGRLPELGAVESKGRVARFRWTPPASEPDLRSVYLRVVQKDQNRGWASPIHTMLE